MNRFIALLRGINISGKNRIPMPDLKASFIELGYTDVRTHLNSGNVVFSDHSENEITLADRIRSMIRAKFGMDIPVFVIAQTDLKHLLSRAPAWWGTENKDIYDNLIFMIPPAKAESIAEKIGEPTKDLEQICICQNAVFWSFDRQRYAKANWWKKTAGAGIGELITIRTANTLRKIAEM